jgi:hypothetical protein
VRREPDTVLPLKRARNKHIHIILSHDDELGEWSVEIDGDLYAHISTDVIEALVECKLINSYSLLGSQQCSDGETVN